MKIALNILKLCICAALAYFIACEQIPALSKEIKKLDAREAAYEKEKAAWPKRRAQDSITTVRYCERMDSMIRELKEVTRTFNVRSRFPDNVTQKEYDEIMK